MEKCEFYSKIEKYAVRIGINDVEQTLCGSGTLFPVITGQEMCVLTVAHVVLPLKHKMETDGQAICLSCKDSFGELHDVIVDNPETLYIHSKYKEWSEEDNRQEYFYDSAVIRIPWDSWMDELKGYQLKPGEEGIAISGYGFPEALDREKNRSQANAFAGVDLFEGNIENRNVGRLAVKYNGNVDGEIQRDSKMKGYSGTGLFSLEKQGVYFRGMISCSRGERAAGFTLWATDVEMILELMSESDIEMEYPDSFQPYRDMVASEFPSFKTECIRNWKESVDGILENNAIIPKMFEPQVKSSLPCEGNRKTCADFWKGKIKELVVMHEVQQIPKEQLIQPTVQLPQPYENEKVSLEFLCTELKAESILGKMIEDKQFAKDGGYYNNMIMLLNGKKGHDNCTVFYQRKDCRNIMGNIAGQYESYTTKELREITEHLLDVNEKNIIFDIIKGSMEKCNIAAVGTGKLMEILNKEKTEDMKKKMDNTLEELWEE